MLILSTFTSDYIKTPLQDLIKNFNSETVSIQYTDTNLLIWVTRLYSSEEKKQSVIILFRLIDLIEVNGKIDRYDLEENLNKLAAQIIELKKIKEEAFIVVLCPSPDCFYDKNFKDLESSFLKKMQNNKIHSLSAADIYQYYALTDFENKREYNTRIPYTFEFYAGLAGLLARKLHCITQPPYKVIIVDCDNTLWTGIAGDIGPENVKIEKHNRHLQEFLVKQKENGVFICICSKNELPTVKKVFSRKKGDMLLDLDDDFKIKKINRDAKSSNIKAIIKDLTFANAKNAMFIDDSEDEIGEVSPNLPEIFCVQMPQTIAEFNKIWAFDINEYLSITQTDKDRLKLIQQEEALKSYFSQIKDPIESLKAKREKQHLIISKIKKENVGEIIERIEQIPKRTNQFNLFPFSENPEKEWNLENLIKTDQIDCFIATLRNKSISKENKVEEKIDSAHGDLTALAVCKIYNDHLLVHGFFLSCRNTGLEVEYALARKIAKYAKLKKLDKIKFKFKKTEVNKLAETFIDILSQETNKHFDFNKTLNKEMIFEFSVNSLIQLDPYVLMDKTIKFNAVNTNIPNERLISPRDLENAKLYLPALQNETGNIQSLVEKFKIDCQENNDLSLTLFNKIKEVISGETSSDKTFDIPLDESLTNLGFDSFNLIHLSNKLFDQLKVNVNPHELLGSEMTVSKLLKYFQKKKDKQYNFPKELTLDELKQGFLKISMQEKRIFSAEQSEGVTNSYRFHMLACFLAYELNINYFKDVYKRMIQSHDVFGFHFSAVNGQLTKSCIPPESRKINFYHEEMNHEFEFMDVIREKTSKPLSMIDSNELIRLFIFQTAKKYYIFFHVHHCIFDASSLNICLDFLSKHYNARSKSISLELPTPPLSYQSYINYQNDKIRDENFQHEARKFWSQHLSICEGVVEIPSDKSFISSSHSVTELKANRQEFELSLEDTQALSKLASANGVTVYTVIMSLFSILIANYSYNEIIPITTATSGREAFYLNTPGFFVNLLVHVFNLKENKTISEFMIENHNNLMAGIKFQDLPLSDIKEYCISNNAAVVFQSDEIPKLLLEGKSAELVFPKSIILDIREHCRFSPLTLFIQKVQQRYILLFEYAEAKYSQAYIMGILKNLIHTIKSVCDNPNQYLQEISVVHDEESNKLKSLGQGPQLHYAEDDNLVKRFQHTVAKYPNNIALCYGNERLSYKELDQQSANLAHALLQKGVQQGDYVGIFLKASHLFFIAELAILKLGCVFIPLSTEHPPKHLNSIIEDAKINYFIIENDTKWLFGNELASYKLIYIDSLNKNAPVDSLPPVKTKEDRFCILYTSGSTGNPKGVVLLEKGIYRVVESSGFIKVFPESKVAQTADQAFDAAQLECWLAWNNGASLIVINKETILDPDLFKEKITEKNITHMWLTAGLFNMHALEKPDLFNNLKYLMVGGDQVHKEKVQKILELAESPIIINGYGPTETSIFALTYTFNKQTLASFETSPIGLPINNTSIQILTLFGGLAPLGAIGELCIAGEGVSEGYLNLQDLNKEKFIYNDKQKSYLSGDLVTINQQQIIFKRRATNKEIKINGHRVNLEGIRACLSRHEAIQDVEVISISDNEMHTKNTILGINEIAHIVAFFTLKKSDKAENITPPTHQEFVSYLRENFPIYGAVSSYCELKEIPTNLNGKLDKNRLVNHYKLIRNDKVSTENISGCEKKVLEIFKEVLPNFSNDLKADFFDWGANSLQAMLLVNKINGTFKETRITTNDLYANRTVALLAILIKKPKANIKKPFLRLLKKGDDSLPTLVCLHTAGGSVNDFYELIERTNLDNPCYGIEDPLLVNGELKKISMEEMAGNYLSMIENEIQGPFILIGYSFGGMLALEMAAQKENGESKNNNLLGVVLLDTWVVSCASQIIKDKLIEDVLKHCAVRREKADIHKCSPEIMEKLEELCEHHQDIGFIFRPKKLKTSMVYLFKATILDDNFSAMNEQDEDKNNYLSKFINKTLFKAIEIAATHYDLLENPDKNNLTEIFSECINKINQKIYLSKLDKVSMKLFRPLSEINNDPQFSCLTPRIKQ